MSATWLATNWLRERGRDEQPEGEHAPEETRAETAPSAAERAAKGDVEDEHRRPHRQRHRRHAKQKIRGELADQQFDGADRRRHQRLHRTPLPFARYDERGQQRADECHVDGDEAGEQKIGAFVRRIIPEARHQCDRQRCSQRFRARSTCLFLGEPGPPEAEDIVLHEARGIGIAPVHQDLDRRGLAAGGARRKRSRKRDDAYDTAGDEIGFALAPVANLVHRRRSSIARTKRRSSWRRASAPRRRHRWRRS